jgi:rfaE bifunctional protein kinase chain/domain
MNERDRLLAIIDRMAGVRVALLGDLVLDRFVLGTPKRISREAPVIILRFEGQQDIPGGAANALANLAALDVEVVPVGVVGDDEPGQALLKVLAQQGVNTGTVLKVPGYRTPTKVRVLGGGASSLKHQVARYDIEDKLPATGIWHDRLLRSLHDAIASAAAVALSDYGYGTVSPEAVQEICGGRSGQPMVCADSRYRLRELAGVSGITPNLQELEEVVGRQLVSDDEVAEAAEELRQALGASFVLATRGNQGMTLVETNQAPTHLPVFGSDEVADVTGAGDTVLAVLVAALAAGASPKDSAALANYGGGIVVMKLGTATLNQDELRAAVRHHLSGGAG